MPIAPIAPIAALGNTSAVSGAAAAPSASPSSGGDFAAMLSNGLDAVSGAQSSAGALSVQAASGTLTDPAELAIATTKAALMTQLATTVQSKAVAAFNEVMGMQA